MTTTTLMRDLEEALREVPILDVHTHLVGGRLGALGLHDVLLYHMVVTDLYAAGCPTGARLTQFPAWPDETEAHARIQEALPFLTHIRNTSSAWGVRIILADLYGWHQPITADNWRRLDELIRERAHDRAYHRQLLDRLNIRRSGTELARRGDGGDDDRLQYALEWGFFTRCQWGEFDTALYELERCWGRSPDTASPIGAGPRPSTDRAIRTLEDVQAAIEHYVRSIPHHRILATAQHLSTDIDYTPVTDAEMDTALSCRTSAGRRERDIYASYVHDALLTAMERSGERTVFQFSLGAEPLPFETGSRLSQRTILQVGEMIARHPQLRFQCFLASQHGNQALCTLARELPNLSLAGYWWHNFFPSVMERVMAERLDMLPVNKQIGFFSDAYCLEWTHAKVVMVRKQMARVFARKIADGQFSRDDAIGIARSILYESPQQLLGMSPSTKSRPPADPH